MTESFRTEEMFFMMKKINLDWTAQLEMKFPRKDVTGVQLYFLVYILRHHPKGTYITELCHEIGVAKSTLSELIKKLREKDISILREIRMISGRKSGSHRATVEQGRGITEER